MKKLPVLHIANNAPLVLFAGPCVIEDEKKTRQTARFVVRTARAFGMTAVFKGSYDKANRSSVTSFRGVGLEKGLGILGRIRASFGLPVMTDVHCRADVAAVAAVCDVIQIPAFLSRQTDLLLAAGRTGRCVNIKKGQFMAPEDAAYAVAKVASTGNRNIFVTERGVSFGYHNLVVDMRGIEIIRRTNVPVIFDATHAVQQPGGLGCCSGGDRSFVAPLARAAVAVGVAGLFLEVHPDPKRARSDGPNSVDFGGLEEVLRMVLPIDHAVKKILRGKPRKK